MTRKPVFIDPNDPVGVRQTFERMKASLDTHTHAHADMTSVTADQHHAQAHGLLHADHADTLVGSVVRGDLIVGNTTPKWSRLAKGTQYTSLVMGADAPAWGQVNLAQATAITGTLAIANGGTGAAISAIQYGVPYFSSTTTMASTAAGATNQVLHGNAAGVPVFGPVVLDVDVSGVLPTVSGGTGTSLSGYSQGDMLYATGAQTLALLAKNTSASRFLSNQGTNNNPAWAQVGASGSGTLPGARVYASGGFSVPNNAWSSINQFDSEDYDNDSMFAAISPSNLTVNTAGKYIIGAHVYFAPNAVGARGIRMTLNGNVRGSHLHLAPGAYNAYMSISSVCHCAVNDLIRVELFQDSGAALNAPYSGGESPYIWAQWVGP